MTMESRLMPFLVLILTAGVYSQDDESIDAVLETNICRKCICKENKVNCFDQNIETFFSKDEWAVLADFKPKVVDLSENHIENVTAIAELPIQVLNLSRCNIDFIENASFQDLQEMQVLDLSHNQLTKERLSPHSFEGRYSPSEFRPLSSMRTLNLAYNDLHSLHPDLFKHLPELEVLDLSGNPLTTIDRVTLVAISSLPMMKVLRLRSCQLTEIPDKFLHTPRYLERLDISDNKLTAVPQELEETKNLLFLNLNQNPIVELDATSEDYPGFPRLRKLKELHMCNMAKLRSVGPSSLAGLEAIEIIHMSFNPSLSNLDPRALARPDEKGTGYEWPLVKELYLQSNNLSEINSEFLSRWDFLQKVDMSDNPFLCDCTTQWMVDFLVPVVESKGANGTIMKCAEPLEMRGYTFRHLHESQRKLKCDEQLPERGGSILLGTLIGVLLAVPIVLGLILMWRRGYFAWIGLRPPRDASRAFYKRAPADEDYII